MNVGLVQRALREILPTTIALASVLAAVSVLMAIALPRFQARMLESRFVPAPIQQFRNALLGVDGQSGGIGEVAFAIGWSHPVLLILLLGHAIIVASRVPAGEVERGTIDVLLGLPTSRWRLFMSETVAIVIGGAVVLAAVYAGSYVGARWLDPEMRPDFARLLRVLANLGLVYTVVAAGAMAASALSDRRGRAVMVVVVLLVFSLLINFLHTLDASLEFTRALVPLSFLNYYKPIGMLMRGEWPVRDLVILGTATVVLWTFAGVVMSRRPLTTL